MQTQYWRAGRMLRDMLPNEDSPARQRKRKNYIQQWMEYRDLKPKDLRDATGADKTIEWKWRTKDNFPTEEYLGLLLALLATDRESLFQPPPGKAGEGKDRAFVSVALDLQADLVATVAPVIAWVSAGQLMSDSAIDEAIGTARAVLGPGDWIALRVEGESMDRISPPGSIIFVDRKDKRLVNGAFYVIDDGEGEATYKRFVAGEQMKFEPVSKNKDLPAIYPDNEPTIVGRVKLTMLDLT